MSKPKEFFTDKVVKDIAAGAMADFRTKHGIQTNLPDPSGTDWPKDKALWPAHLKGLLKKYHNDPELQARLIQTYGPFTFGQRVSFTISALRTCGAELIRIWKKQR